MKAIAYWDIDSLRIRRVLNELKAGFDVRLAATLGELQAFATDRSFCAIVVGAPPADQESIAAMIGAIVHESPCPIIHSDRKTHSFRPRSRKTGLFHMFERDFFAPRKDSGGRREQDQWRHQGKQIVHREEQRDAYSIGPRQKVRRIEVSLSSFSAKPERGKSSSRTPSTPAPPAGITPSSHSTAPPFLKTSSKANSSGRKGGLSPMPCATKEPSRRPKRQSLSRRDRQHVAFGSAKVIEGPRNGGVLEAWG